jgi:hypothetical protein
MLFSSDPTSLVFFDYLGIILVFEGWVWKCEPIIRRLLSGRLRKGNLLKIRLSAGFLFSIFHLQYYIRIIACELFAEQVEN